MHFLQYGVERVKILTAGKLEIEALFADRRNSGEENANILVSNVHFSLLRLILTT